MKNKNIAGIKVDDKILHEEINKLIYEFCCKCIRVNYNKNDYKKLRLNTEISNDFL